MPLLENDRFITDGWIAIADDELLPPSGDLLLSFERLEAEWDALTRHDGRLGARVPNTAKAEALRLYLPRLALIELPFPAFTDGRAYSLARQIRDLGFTGTLRAAGNVLPDQLQYMKQLGFDSFAVCDRFPEDVWMAAARQMSVTYQRGLHSRESQRTAFAWEARGKESGKETVPTSSERT